MKKRELINKLAETGLRVTPQRLLVYEIILKHNNHPTAEEIMAYVKKKFPNIAIGTIYKIIDSLIEKKLITRVKTDKDIMRYEAVLSHHHHLYCSKSDIVIDYFNQDIDKIVTDYFNKNKIPDFEIEDIKLQIIGCFKK
ncbi:MAG TPA: transcriptional repressor [Bacteroidales bacterium]|nr:transcriptional repressor [Bacteroidales bacterium]